MVKSIWMVTITCFVIAGIAIALHSPGHISYDSTLELYQASIGKVVGAHPPLTTLVMHLLGGGEKATSLLVFFFAFMTYGSFALTFASATQHALARNQNYYIFFRLLIIYVLILNPVIFFYVGIIWKDVFFASLLAFGVSAGIASGLNLGYKKYTFAFASFISLILAMFVRQQGLLIAPLLLFIPLKALTPNQKNLSKKNIALGIIFFSIMFMSLLLYAKSKIEGIDQKPIFDGFKSLMVFDIAGTISCSKHLPPDPIMDVPIDELLSMSAGYNPARLDTLFKDPVANRLWQEKTLVELGVLWWRMIKNDPEGYLYHRSLAYATLLGLRGIEHTLPMHVGVEGHKNHLDELGIFPGQDSRDKFLYNSASMFFGTPLFYHIFWLIVFLIGLFGLYFFEIPRFVLYSARITSFAVGILYLSYIPTMFASDFRYLYPTIPLITIIWILIVVTGRRSRESSATTPHDHIF